jgi:hypothetical protein
MWRLLYERPQRLVNWTNENESLRQAGPIAIQKCAQCAESNWKTHCESLLAAVVLIKCEQP